jgi:O-antigen/teichoic acid export membrane protein
MKAEVLPIIAVEPDNETVVPARRRFFLAGLLGERLAVGVLWNVIGAVFNQGSTFLLGIIVAKSLGRELYGAFGFLQGTLFMFTNLAQLALGFAATKYIAEYRVNDKPRAGRVIALCIGVSLVTGILTMSVALAAARPIAVTLARQPAVEAIIRLAAPTILFVAVGATLTGALAGMQRYRLIALVGLASGIAYVSIGSAAAAGWRLPGVAVGLSLSALLQCLLLFLVMKSGAASEGIPIPPISRRLLERERSVLTDTALPAALSGLTTLPAMWLISAILARQPDGMSQLALFSAANSLRLLVGFVPALINNVGFSVLSGHKGSADSHAYWRVFRTNLLMVTGIALAGAALMAVAGRTVLQLYGSSFTDGYPVLLILLISTLAEAAAIAAYQLIQTHGNMWLSVFVVSLPRDVVLVVLALGLAPRYGAAGLSMAMVGGALATLTSVAILAVRTRHAVAERAATAQ